MNVLMKKENFLEEVLENLQEELQTPVNSMELNLTGGNMESF